MLVKNWQKAVKHNLLFYLFFSNFVIFNHYSWKLGDELSKVYVRKINFLIKLENEN